MIQNTSNAYRYHTHNTQKLKKISSETTYYITQKLIGIFLVIVGFVVQEFATLFFGLLLGIPLIFTKEKLLMIGKVYWAENPIERRSND